MESSSSQSMTESKTKLEPNELWKEEEGWSLELPKQKHKTSLFLQNCPERGSGLVGALQSCMTMRWPWWPQPLKDHQFPALQARWWTWYPPSAWEVWEAWISEHRHLERMESGQDRRHGYSGTQTHTEGRPHEDTGRRWHLQAQERPQGNQSYWHLDLGLPTSRPMRKNSVI